MRRGTHPPGDSEASLKEIRLRPRIEVHDFEVKARKLRQFLDEGEQVTLTVLFRGREIVHPDIGENLLSRFVLTLPLELAKGTILSKPRLEGKRMTLTINPRKRG
jgi:translation initiation factor IF-3